jgi:hypothetical protein
MADAIEQLDRATAAGWRLVGVKLLREAQGFYRLDARLARPGPAAVSCSTPAAIAERAA